MKRVRRMAAVIAAVGLSLLMTGEAMAVSWSPKVALTSSRSADAAALVTLGSNHAAAVIENSGKIFVRRSADSGATWKSALRLDTAYSLFAAIGGYGTDVDVVWTKSSNYDQDSALKYVRSTNYGRTFTSAVTLASLSDPSSSGIYARVAHGPGGVVAVAWHQFVGSTEEVDVRVSADNGASFGATRTLVTSNTSYFRPPAVAVGNGVIYVAYFPTDSEIDLRRSLDNGATWTAPVTIATNAYANDDIRAVSIAADGDSAYLAYSARHSTSRWVRFRSTADDGASWTAPVNIAPRSGYHSYLPIVSYAGGAIRLVYDQCTSATCGKTVVKYTESPTGTSWTSPVKASARAKWASAEGVGYASRIIVLYTAFHSGDIAGPQSDVYVRTGS